MEDPNKIGIVLQDPPPKSKKKLYRPQPFGRTVIVPKDLVLELLLTEERSRIISESYDTQIVDEDKPPYEIPTVFWGIARRFRDFEATTYPHHLRPLSPAEEIRSKELTAKRQSSDEQTLREKYREELTRHLYSPNEISERLKDIKHWGLEVPPEIVENYNLREGYEVHLKIIKDPKNPNQKLLVIFRVNGNEDPEVVRNLPLPLGVRQRGKKSLRVSYARKMIEWDRYGSVPIREFYLLGAWAGHGDVFYLRGEGGLGKTGISVEAWKATLRLTLEEPKNGEKPVYAFLAFVGERDMDLDDLYKRAQEETPHNPDRVEVVFATKTDDLIYQWQVFEYAISRVRVLGLFYNVIAFYDSGPRAVEAYSAVAKDNEPLVSGGVVKKGIDTVAREAGAGGYFPETNTSITALILTLDGDPKDPATMLDRLTKERETTGLWSLNRNAQGWPPIDTLERNTYVRRKELHVLPELAAESAFVLGIARRMIGGKDGQTAPPEVVLERLHGYVKLVPLPAYVTGKEFKVETVQTQWERMINLSERLRKTLNELNSIAYQFLLDALAQQNGFSGKIAVVNSKGDITGFFILPVNPGDGFVFVKSDDPKFAQILGGEK
ncbi:hypothetical protein A2962_05440 [Candidatus Woesebacteria bacterium RIFCSPLOWO2_01_FULL_39_61]|uniref:Uncharacterized protein n=1 Tax=Candidatus Woesebacteria bacterium RIFCSPHIGHO2_02_FULL_39_13 TaxID=1802505 RepID=A0A1F7Z5C8_9BACT|nr:MAG: hypothetical protein A2692_00755 [Candidatus Woesebacteria bacterium RIFCSPHIGHO2_01_FULL_39_95]OGM34651.1 MAG: hypothetical protein A3D01_06445 [Candidatus Woesebacteria bacterium RIFCSPHIGHO2_02_FULL_39_13]OGM37393.1 MAG: hypothetical protein A3E13_05475 [Candidatus Woesebacteria bacterium RIFCSPHIGHO2_12_FULL_40_20]OGM68359.1 MAG: hypothetical protein A2962_05440 [Candidatus Woesebacteria bacterium RIFCSPLOWO2_01_FULL_39_61]OGM71891.1 MAG: hypothetical protein A3H19_05440 [Candidatus